MSSAANVDLWAEEREAYRKHRAIVAELEFLALALDDLERRMGRSEVGRQYASMLGLPESLAPVLGVLILSPSANARRRAGGLIIRALLRSPAREAA